MAGAPRLGTVTDFDEARGLGTISASGGELLPFHCTQIADGTMTIPVGQAVQFEVKPGLLGHWEAAGLLPR